MNKAKNIYWILGLVLLALYAYWNSFYGAFLFDDVNIRKADLHFHTPGYYAATFMYPLERRLVALSFSINYYLGEWNTWGWHAVNLFIHILAGLALFGIVRRTLEMSRSSIEFSSSSKPLAFVIAALFIVHPLQTESVTFIVQRAQSGMGMLSLVGFYFFIRGCGAEKSLPWFAASVFALTLSLNTKPHMFLMPLIIGLYDVIFISDSIREAWRRHRNYYIALAGAWIFLTGNLGQHFVRSDFMDLRLVVAGGGQHRIGLTEYVLSQFGVLAHYMYLIFCPLDLCLDYAWPIASTWQQIVLPALFIVPLVAINIWALFKRPAWGFAGAWFFLQLAPTTFTPRPDLAVEHRLYLALAGVVALVVLSVFYGVKTLEIRRPNWGSSGEWRRRLYMSSGLLILVLGFLTMARNGDYYSEVKMYQDVAAKAPWSVRAHNNLAHALLQQERYGEAKESVDKALRIDPDLVAVQYNLAHCYVGLGKPELALKILTGMESVCGKTLEYHMRLSWVYEATGDKKTALDELRKAVEWDPDSERAKALRDIIAEKEKK